MIAFSHQKITLTMVFVRRKMYLVIQLLHMKLYFRRKTKYLQWHLVIKKKKKKPIKNGQSLLQMYLVVQLPRMKLYFQLKISSTYNGFCS